MVVVVVVDVEQTNHSCKVSCKGSENGEQKKKKKQPMEMEMESNRGINLLLKQNHLFDYSSPNLQKDFYKTCPGRGHNWVTRAHGPSCRFPTYSHNRTQRTLNMGEVSLYG